jgi:hypothetical protein
MRADSPRRLELEVRFDAQPIEGRLYDRDMDAGRAFSGWLGLIAAIEAARANGSSPEHDGRTAS